MSEKSPRVKSDHVNELAITGKKRNRLTFQLITFWIVALLILIYIRTHPQVFNESFFSHAHCMPQAVGALLQYAEEHGGKFPAHTNGYGDALMLLSPEYAHWSVLTGPGYDSNDFTQWKQSGTNVPESECGRVYIQGLSKGSNPDIAILFDKLPTPGDHCHFPKRLWRPFGRDVCFVGTSWTFVLESAWPEFTKNQIELLVKEGFDRTNAEALYAEKGKNH